MAKSWFETSKVIEIFALRQSLRFSVDAYGCEVAYRRSVEITEFSFL